MKNQAIMAGVDHHEMLLRGLIGESSPRLSTRFLVDRLTVNNIVHVFGARYPRVFDYVADARAQGLKQGYVEREGLRRYFDGFGSSSMEKRNIAQVLACRWLLQYGASGKKMQIVTPVAEPMISPLVRVFDLGIY